MRLYSFLFLFLSIACNHPKALTSQPSTDTLLFSYQRTGCFGHCPTYKVNVYSNGQGRFVGQRYVSIMDTLEFTLSTADFQKIQSLRDNPNYQILEMPESDSRIVDAASLIFKDELHPDKWIIQSDLPASITTIVKTVDHQLKKLEYLPGTGENALIQPEILVQLIPNAPIHSLNGMYQTFSLLFLKDIGQQIGLYKIYVVKNKLVAAMEEIKELESVLEIQMNHTLQPR